MHCQILILLFQVFKTTNCLVIPQITGELPNCYFDPIQLEIQSHCQLADPKFHEPGQVDLLIGADTFWDLLDNEKISLGSHKPILHNSRLGWFISGPLGISTPNHSFCHLSTLDVQKQLAKFWEIEELSCEPILSDEKFQAEGHFSDNFKRGSNGRFTVAIPLKKSSEVLGDSKLQATNQFLQLERKLSKNPKLKAMYTDFMTEYHDLGLMSIFSSSNFKPTYYSPHHGVLKEDSSTTKLRVVFNSSVPSSSGVSYNSIQMVEPVVQEDLVSIMLRFRQDQYIISADICKMYRQILVQEEFHPLQLILWRADPMYELQTFSLNTVTYGTASAPFLATRCLKQLAIEYESLNHHASRVISKDFYVDDLLSGADSFEEAVRLCQEVSSILKL
ncbi:uncharacterized protein LOC132705087 [Cylas formicarius]|uniref:uncharacterized protein LOC132705087 n=1 Tax=Cylas formicarius TaxID=197179 RepID=UPI00295869AC|nr:uncharacterized protein LOC132705087 [Cylas formicarius]